VKREPVAVALAGLDTVVAAGLVAANALGWLHLTEAQIAAVVAFVVAVSAVFGTVARSRVVPLDVHADAVVDALFTEPPAVRTVPPSFDPAGSPPAVDDSSLVVDR
jgi:hypothetical protein